jgi:hypothetical protein
MKRLKLTKDRQGNFLKALANTGSVTAAVAMASMSRTRVYELRKADSVFAAGWEEAEEIAADRLEEEARRRAVEGVQEPLQFGGQADRAMIGQDGAIVYTKKRAEMWGSLREWLRTGAVDDDPELHADLIGVEYGYTLRDGRDALILERKEDMKKRGLSSPDNGDAPALTLAYPVAPSDHRAHLRPGSLHQFEYDPYHEICNQPEMRSPYHR